VAVVVAVSGVLSTSQRARAQDDDHAPATPPDVVRLKDGSFFRGTILELVADDHVVLRLSSGETKRFAMDDVKYAGSAADEPKTRRSAESGGADGPARARAATRTSARLRATGRCRPAGTVWRCR
jgi:hypothetical protein